MRSFLFFCISWFTLLIAVGQNNTCNNATPFCTGQNMQFPAGVNAGSAQQGPNYGCLGSQPNPAWFYFQAATSGPMVIAMSATWDIDFICWGPFPNLATACNSLTGANQVPGSGYQNPNSNGCSYSGAPTETLRVQNAVPGQFYILLITNFSNQNQQISFSQTNTGAPGAGQTNCGMICLVTPTNSGRICSGQANTLSLNTSSAVTSFTWFGPNGFTSNNSFLVLNNFTTSTTFTVRGATSATSVSPSNTCSALTTVTVIPYPSFTTAPSNTTICQGGNFFATNTFSIGGITPNACTFSWNPGVGGGVMSPLSQNTSIFPPLAPVNLTLSTLIYSVTVTPTIHPCPVTQTLAVTINNPMTPTLTMPPPLCNTFGAISLTASPPGGTWSGNAAVTSTGQLSPNIAAIGTNTVTYAVTIGSCAVSNTAAFSISQFNTPALTTGSFATLCVQDPTLNLMNFVQTTLTGVWSGGPYVNALGSFTPNGLNTGTYQVTYSTQSTPIASVCPAFTTITIPVFNPPTPTLVAVPQVCNTQGTLSLGASPPGGLWSLNSGVSATGIMTPSMCPIGTSTVLYTAGQGTCVASNTVNLNVSQFNSAALSGTVPHLCVSQQPFNLMGIVQSTLNGSWSGMSVVGAYSFNPFGLPTNTYNLTYSTTSSPNPSLCPDTQTIQAFVLNPPVPVISQVGPFCSKDAPVQLSVSPNTGTWMPTSYLNTSGLFSPSLAAIGSNPVQYVVGTATCNNQNTKLLNVEAFVSSAILNSIPDLCDNNAPFNLSPITLNASGIWSGPGITGANFVPASTGAGLYTLTYSTATSPSGLCPNHSTVAVRVFSLALPSINPTGPFCSNAPPVQLQVSPLGGIFGGYNSGAVNPSGLFRPALGVPGNNIVSYSIAAGPCIAFAQTTVDIETFVSADLTNSYPMVFCLNDQPFNLEAVVKNTSGTWFGPGLSGSLFNPKYANLGNGNLLVYQTHSMPTASLCPDTSALRIRVEPSPTLTLLSNLYKGCAPLEVQFDAAISGALTGETQWFFGDGSATLKSMACAHTFTAPGVYTITAQFRSPYGCAAASAFSVPIEVYNAPTANFNPQYPSVSISNPTLQLLNNSTLLAQNHYSWSLNQNLTSTQVNPIITLPDVGIYTITLLAVSRDGCKHQTSQIIEVKNNFNIFVPNVFTPNHDNLNDLFIPVFSTYGIDFNSYTFSIYNRWGQLLFSTQNPIYGWNGSNPNGSKAPQDNYIYNIQFKDLEGNWFKKTGSFLLLQSTDQ